MSKFLEEEIRKSLINVANEFGKETIAELLTTLKRLDKVASGKLIDSLNYKLRGALTGIEIIFEGEDYLKYVNDGRKPGKFAPVSAIKKWCKSKGIDEKFAYPINLKIKRVGIAPTKFIDEVFNDKKLNAFSITIEEVVGQKLESSFEYIFKN